MTLEICAQSLQSAVHAQKGGAWRIELCQALELGGLTPSSATIQLVSRYLTIPIHVLLRPRVGDFTYSRLEVETIKQDLENAKVMGASGVVVGFLDENQNVETDLLEGIVIQAAPMEVTFHRAIDVSADLEDATRAIIDSGCHRILTSGGAKSAMEGIDKLKNLQEKFGDRISIMAGKGVTSENIPMLAAAGLTEFHMSGSVTYESESPNDLFSMDFDESDLDEIRAARDVIKDLRTGSRLV